MEDKKPLWLRRRLPEGFAFREMQELLSKEGVHTVCEESHCPNCASCWSCKNATFLLMGKECSRACAFCSVTHKANPAPLDTQEPQKVSELVARLQLKSVVLTMVTRDDLDDGGAMHLAETIRAVKTCSPHTVVEVLTSDFQLQQSSIKTVLEARPHRFGHNLETVRCLSSQFRHKATYERSLKLLEFVVSRGVCPVKSGLMVGLGEKEEEVFEAIHDLHRAGVESIVIGQYLQPTKAQVSVRSYINPLQFDRFRLYGVHLGVKEMLCGPYLRSSCTIG
jgi:lipoic acid synthetase